MAYATPDELAAALGKTATPATEERLQACLDAAAIEIDHFIDSAEDPPLDPPPMLALLNRVNLLRGVEWWKANDAAFGALGSEAVGVLGAPRDSFATRHGGTLIPAKERFGVA